MATLIIRCPDCNAHIAATLTRTSEHTDEHGATTVTLTLDLDTALRAHHATSEAHEH